MKISNTGNYIETSYSSEKIIEILKERNNDSLEDVHMRYDVFKFNAPIWKKYNETVKKRHLDIISNTLFYWPLPKSLAYTRKISLSALLSFLERGNTITNEHFYPRKTTTELFFRRILDNDLTFDKFLEMYVNVFGKYHITTPQENKFLQKSYEKKNYTTWQEAYEDNDILLIDDPTYDIMMTEKRRNVLSQKIRQNILDGKLGELAKLEYVQKQKRFHKLVLEYLHDDNILYLPQTGRGSMYLSYTGEIIDDEHMIPITFVKDNIYYYAKSIDEKNKPIVQENHYEEVIEFLNYAKLNTDKNNNNFIIICSGSYFDNKINELKSYENNNIEIKVNIL